VNNLEINDKMPAVGTIILPFYHHSGIRCVFKREYLTKIRPFVRGRWIAASDAHSLESGLVCFVGDFLPERFHNLKIVKLYESSVRGKLIPDHRRIDYVDLIRRIAEKPGRKMWTVRLLQNGNDDRLLQQLIWEASTETVENITRFVCESIPESRIHQMIYSLENTWMRRGLSRQILRTMSAHCKASE